MAIACNSINIKTIKAVNESGCTDVKEVDFVYKSSDETLNFKINDQERMCKTEDIFSNNNDTIFTNSYDIIKCQSGTELNKFLTWFNNLKIAAANKPSDEVLNVYKIAFQNRFNDNKSILKKLKQHIDTCLVKWIKNEIYAPIVVVCQSSGYGKSKSLYEYSQNSITTFMCLRDEKDSGYPPRSNLCSTLIKSFKGNSAQTQKFLIALVEASLEFYDMIVEKHPNLSKEQIASEFRTYQPWLENKIKFTKQDNHHVSFDERVEQLNSSLDNQIDHNKLNVLKEAINERMQSLTIVIDEAHVLATQFVDGRSHFLDLRSAIIFLFKDSNIVFVMTSTNTSITDFNLSEYQITNSQRASKLDNYPPFCKLVFCDQLKSKVYEENFKKAFQTENNLLNFINKRKPVDTIFYYGRPLWCSINIANNHHTRQDILNLAKVKLIRANNWTDTQLNKTYASLAILASTTNILNNIAIINRDLTSNLIAGYMATLFHADDNCSVLSFRYVSEPILAEAAAFYLSNDSILKDVLERFYETMVSSNIISTGLIGELAAEIIFLIASYKSNKQNYFSKPIKVKDFLFNLVGKESFYEKNIENSFLDGIVSFTHFNQKLDVLKKDNLLYDFIQRSAAGRFKAYFPQYDHFIPVIFCENKIGLILIQIKNRVDLQTNDQLKKIAGELNYKIFKKKEKSKLFTDFEVDRYNSLKILINLGGDHESVFFSSDTLIISSIEAFNIDKQIKEILKTILNYSRNDMAQYEDKDVCRIVTYGCASDDFFT